MDFRTAIMALKKGDKIRRTGWQTSYYLVLVRLNAQGPITKADDYVEATLGITQPMVTTRIDCYTGDEVLQESWIATAEDIAGEWQMWPQTH